MRRLYGFDYHPAEEMFVRRSLVSSISLDSWVTAENRQVRLYDIALSILEERGLRTLSRDRRKTWPEYLLEAIKSSSLRKHMSMP